MPQFIRNILLATLPGLLIAAATYYFFTAKDREPSRSLSISSKEQIVPVSILTGLMNTALPGEKTNEVVRRQFEYFSDYTNFTLGTFAIKNNSSHEIQGLDIRLKGVKAAVLQNEQDKKLILTDGNHSITVSPSSTAKLSVVRVGYHDDFAERFMLNGELLDVDRLDERTYEDPLQKWTREHSGVTFLVWMFAVLILGIFAFMIVARAILISRPHLWAQTADSQRLVESLVAINFLKLENREKFDDIVMRATEHHKRWRERMQSMPPTQND